jgi:hypothetical protein
VSSPPKKPNDAGVKISAGERASDPSLFKHSFVIRRTNKEDENGNRSGVKLKIETMRRACGPDFDKLR